jgi:hypothetical protein
MDLKSSAKKYQVQLYRSRNSLTGVARLSDETICTIMSYGRLGHVIHCSLICYRWRQVALNQPSLWAQIDLTRQKLNAKLVSIQIERSGDYPLDIKFGGGRHQYSSLSLLPSLASLLSRARAVREIEPQMWLELGILESFQMPYLEQIEGKFDASSLQYISKSPGLIHVSVAVNFQRLFPDLKLGRYLRTLCISNASDFPTTVLSVISELSHLKELYLISMFNTNISDLDYENSMLVRRFPNLRFLCVKDCPYSFVVRIGKPPFISKFTNIFIQLNISQSISPAPLHRERGPSTLWIDHLHQNSFLISYPTSLIELVLRSDNDIKPISELPRLIQCDHITALELNGSLPTAEDMSIFTRLAQLKIQLQVKPASVEKRSLTTTLNAVLPYSCPRLTFIGLLLQRMGPESALYGDGAGAAVEHFLKEWVRCYGKPFGVIQVQDGVNPVRWHRRLTPRFKSMLQSFDLMTMIVSVPYSRPRLPVTRYEYRTP